MHMEQVYKYETIKNTGRSGIYKAMHHNGGCLRLFGKKQW